MWLASFVTAVGHGVTALGRWLAQLKRGRAADAGATRATVIRPSPYTERLSVEIRVDVSDSSGMFLSAGMGGGERSW